MNKPFTVNYDTYNGLDYDESFETLRLAMHRYNNLHNIPFKSLTFDDYRKGTVTLLNSKGEDNLRQCGFLPCDYN